MLTQNKLPLLHGNLPFTNNNFPDFLMGSDTQAQAMQDFSQGESLMELNSHFSFLPPFL